MMLGLQALSKKRGLSNERNFQGCCLRNPLQAIEQSIVCLFDRLKLRLRQIQGLGLDIVLNHRLFPLV